MIIIQKDDSDIAPTYFAYFRGSSRLGSYFEDNNNHGVVFSSIQETMHFLTWLAFFESSEKDQNYFKQKLLDVFKENERIFLDGI